MRLLSEAGEYALRAVVWMAQRPGQPHKTREIAPEIQAAPGYLVKVLQGLARAGILSAARGRRGGFTLIRDAEDLTILEVLNAVDPLARIRSCPLGLEAHAGRLCAMHQRVDDALAVVEAEFEGTTVGDLRRGTRRRRPLCEREDPSRTSRPARRRGRP